MSDRRLLDLRRRAEQGDVGAAAALLTERIRIGEVTVEGVDLAAFVGDEIAALVVRLEDADVPRTLLEFGRALRARWEREECLRVVLASVQPLIDPTLHPSRDPTVPIGSATAVQAITRRLWEWISCPCEEHAWEIRRYRSYTPGLSPWSSAACQVVFAPITADLMFSALEVPGRVFGEAAVRAAIRREVAPWALGERDPLRERVEATS